MSITKNITGQRFGKLQAISRVEKTHKNERTKWHCQCECGNVCIVRLDSLTCGNTRSCGCIPKKQLSEIGKRAANNLTNMKFGRLSVICSTSKRINGFIVWKCLCDCGKTTYVRSSSLLNGHTASCGCLQKDRIVGHYTHGMTHTKVYKQMKTRQYHERKLLLDSNWTLEMELTLKTLQPACVVCHTTKNLSIDHVMPLSKGYGLKPGNAVVLCKSCNSKKRNKMPEELPDKMKQPILSAAGEFNDYWNRLYILK